MTKGVRFLLFGISTVLCLGVMVSCAYQRASYNGGWRYYHEGGPLNDPVGSPER